jgi:hypothetical protein
LRRLHFFEIFVAVNLAAVFAFFSATLPLLGGALRIFAGLVLSMLLQTAAGVTVRCVVAAVRGDRAYFAIIRSRSWLLETARAAFGFALVIFTYGWIKLIVPVEHPVLYDQALWNLDQAAFFGLAPTLFFLDLFGNGAFLRAIDWAYANIFFTSVLVAGTYFLSEPSRRIRIAFTNGYAVLWVTGAWLYMLVPSVGPAYRFPDLWLAHEHSLRVTQSFQALLMRNYQNVLRAAAGQPGGPIRIAFGIAAFPSLHVAFQTYVFLWMRRLWKSGEVLFGLFAATIFLGSMITGWHYLVDGLAGVALAVACYVIFSRRARLTRWLELRRV